MRINLCTCYLWYDISIGQLNDSMVDWQSQVQINTDWFNVHYVCSKLYLLPWCLMRFELFCNAYTFTYYTLRSHGSLPNVGFALVWHAPVLQRTYTWERNRYSYYVSVLLLIQSVVFPICGDWGAFGQTALSVPKYILLSLIIIRCRAKSQYE